MSYPVFKDPRDPTVPLWLSRGRRAAEISDEGGQSGVSGGEISERLRRELGIESRRAREFERLYRFICTRHEDVLRTGLVKAGSNAVAELIRLQRLNPARAETVAHAVLTGQMISNDVRRVVNEELSSGITSPGNRKLEARRRGVEYERGVVKRVCADPSLLKLGPVDAIWPPPRGEAFIPNLIAQQGELKIAVEIKLGGTSVASHEVGVYLARLAQLEQRFDRSMLVLPETAAHLADAARRMQHAWDGRDVHVVLL